MPKTNLKADEQTSTTINDDSNSAPKVDKNGGVGFKEPDIQINFKSSKEADSGKNKYLTFLFSC